MASLVNTDRAEVDISLNAALNELSPLVSMRRVFGKTVKGLLSLEEWGKAYYLFYLAWMSASDPKGVLSEEGAIRLLITEGVSHNQASAHSFLERLSSNPKWNFPGMKADEQLGERSESWIAVTKIQVNGATRYRLQLTQKLFTEVGTYTSHTIESEEVN